MILDRIVAYKREELQAARARRPMGEWQKRARAAPAPRGFLAAVAAPAQVNLIAEVKKASPSRGVLRADFDPLAIARTYADHGAAALSVLTDERFFQGSPEYLEGIRKEVDLPLLRKEFIIDPYQIWEARALGADAVLLIVAILALEELRSLRELIEELGMAALVEVHSREELELALKSGARLIGINNRDLRTFETSLETTFRLSAQVPAECVLVSESGIFGRVDVERLAAAGVSAILVGEALVREPDIASKVEELANVPRETKR